MESTGGNTDTRSKRQAIARRSCDQCRSRKIGCDRDSPTCSNCVSARLDCTHSAVAVNAKAPKQRVLISAQYEQKIDDIAKGIDGIKLLLQGLNLLPDAVQPEHNSVRHLTPASSLQPPAEDQLYSLSEDESLWDHSAHIIEFLKAVVQDRGSSDVGPEESEVLLSLRSLIRALDMPTLNSSSSISVANLSNHNHTGSSMPPLEAVVAVLRWAKDHEDYTRIAWISRVFPLQKFAEVCQKVYFPIQDYSEAEYIIANGVLSHIFAEHVVISGLLDYREYCQLCRKNLHIAISQLPLLLPASIEVIAALTLAAYNSIENSKATAAWTFISAASDLCQRLGYHRVRPTREIDPTVRTTQEHLFWTVYRLEKGLSLRFGRSSTIHDAEITLPIDANELQSTKIARIIGKVYGRLYSPTGLSRSNDDRGRVAEELAGELRDLINKIHLDIADTTGQPINGESDPMRIVYLRCDLVCQSSLLTLILRAIPTVPNSVSGVSDECVAVAREVMEIHQQCIMDVRACKNDPSMVTKYINWALLHTPFVPFSILFTRAVQFLDLADLALLDRFTASLKPDGVSTDSITHPYRLYELLCQTARLYINSRTVSSLMNTALTPDMTTFLDDSALLEMGLVAGEEETLELDGSQMYGLSDWYYGNQQIMSLIDNNMNF
ncbi:hypothetical protein F4820DRAFT_359771 [Hypoxylon rubiginosum]|uniref:Uncharacterized protein n=1 Tax=Hypoxylon rubiginosum TaxID=110542 RepID=A0ACB9YWF8_9PEZI|nr:hypothetical protein F4820DRAFT_359771 [Hypoxylon rubiginosum]